MELASMNSLLPLLRSRRPYELLHSLKQARPTEHDVDEALHEAAWMGDVLATKILLSAGANMKSLNQYGEPLLVEVAYSEEPALLEFLLKKGYDVNYHTGDSSVTGMVVPLHIAVSHNMTAMTDLLLSAGVNTEYRNSEGDTVLGVACRNGNIALVRSLLQAKCIVNAAGKDGNTALHRASDNGFADITSLLLEFGADPNVENDDGNTSIHVACDNGSCDCVVSLIACGRLDAARLNKENKNCFHYAAVNGKDVIRVLTEAGVPSDRKDSFGNTPLIIAAFMRCSQFGIELIKCTNALSLNARGEQNRTAMHWACHHGQKELVTSLLSCEGIETDNRDDKFDTPLILAARAKEITIAKLLILADCDISILGSHGRSALHWAAVHGLVDLIDEIIKKDDGNVNEPDADGNTPLVLAAIHRHYIEMRTLLEQPSINVNLVGEEGRSALHWVCMRGYTDMVQHLLNQAAVADIRDANGDTPLILASKHHNENVIRELVDASVDTNIVGYLGRTALHHACAADMLKSARLLLSVKFTDVNIRDEHGNTPLILAASIGQEEIMKLLLETHSCDTNVIGDDGKTALAYVAEKGLPDISKRLLACGALPDYNRSDTPPLVRAARNGHHGIVQQLLKCKASVDQTDANSRTALMWACQGGFANIVKMLIMCCANAQLQDISGDTALTLAAWRGHADVLDVIMPFSDIDHRENEDQMTALHLSVSKNNRMCATRLLACGARIDMPDARGNNVLLTAAMHAADSQLLRTILESNQNLDVNYEGEKGRSAIHWLVGDPASVRVILAYKPELNNVDDNGASPLLLAIAHQQPASAKLLADANCDINMLHEDGRRPIHHAAIYGDSQTTLLFLNMGIDPNTETDDGRTPILLAAIEGHVDVARQLIAHKCHLNRVYCDAMTALSIATTNRHYDVMNSFLDAGAHPDLIGSQKHRALTSCILNNDFTGAVLLMRAGANMAAIHNEKQHPLELAIIKGFSRLVKAIVIARCDVNVIGKFLKQGLLYYFLSDNDLLEKLKRISTTPPSLQLTARTVARQCIHAPIQINLQKLPVPSTVKDYLCMRELDNLCSLDSTINAP